MSTNVVFIVISAIDVARSSSEASLDLKSITLYPIISDGVYISGDVPNFTIVSQLHFLSPFLVANTLKANIVVRLLTRGWRR
jgi:hypothetical protein